MTSKTITFNADEQITNSFERACADMGITLSDAIIALMKTALKERRLLSETADTSFIGETDYLQQQREAGYAFLANIAAADGELTDEDFAELESGKYKLKLDFRKLDL